MEIRILAGRIFAPDEADAIVISQRLARAMYGNGNVLGEGFPKSAPKSTVVGRVASAISAGIGGLTLVLACLGIFGVVSYGVALRTTALSALTPALKALHADPIRSLRHD